MKIPALRRKIIIACVILISLIATLVSVIVYNISQEDNLQNRIQKIRRDTNEVRGKITELQSKTIEIKKYRESWSGISANKKNVNGIKMDDVNAKLASVAEKYGIIQPSIKVTLPETLKDGIFNRATVNVLFTTVNLTFEATDDISAISFIEEFISYLPGYKVVNSADIRKIKSYTDQDLIALSIGKGTGAVSGKVDFFWYAYKDKLDPSKSAKETIPEKANAKK